MDVAGEIECYLNPTSSSDARALSKCFANVIMGLFAYVKLPDMPRLPDAFSLWRQWLKESGPFCGKSSKPVFKEINQAIGRLESLLVHFPQKYIVETVEQHGPKKAVDRLSKEFGEGLPNDVQKLVYTIRALGSWTQEDLKPESIMTATSAIGSLSQGLTIFAKIRALELKFLEENLPEQFLFVDAFHQHYSERLASWATEVAEDLKNTRIKLEYLRQERK